MTENRCSTQGERSGEESFRYYLNPDQVWTMSIDNADAW